MGTVLHVFTRIRMHGVLCCCEIVVGKDHDLRPTRLREVGWHLRTRNDQFVARLLRRQGHGALSPIGHNVLIIKGLTYVGGGISIPVVPASSERSKDQHVSRKSWSCVLFCTQQSHYNHTTDVPLEPVSTGGIIVLRRCFAVHQELEVSLKRHFSEQIFHGDQVALGTPISVGRIVRVPPMETKP